MRVDSLAVCNDKYVSSLDTSRPLLEHRCMGEKDQAATAT